MAQDLNVLERHKELLAKWAIQLASWKQVGHESRLAKAAQDPAPGGASAAKAEPAAPAALAAPALPAALAALAAPEADQPEDPKEPEVELPEAEPETAEESEEEVLPEPQGFESAREVARQKPLACNERNATPELVEEVACLACWGGGMLRHFAIVEQFWKATGENRT